MHQRIPVRESEPAPVSFVTQQRSTVEQMQYQALYRKYRPQRFDEVIGQDHVTTTLAREVVDSKVAHAYLLAGPRGTGKTTTARLLAKSLNCANRAPDGEPDNECPSCIGITEGSSLDVIELDAASHNKVEDIREIRTNAGTVAATAGSHRVYILDEAHMLTRAAGNALLKILEEPPAHVIFVLATTEPYKLLDTIRSRAQRFDFHPVATETLIDYLADIAVREGFTADRAALEAVTSHSGGSVRDAMSLLEQVAALGAGTVSSSGVSTALGLADRDVFAELVKVIADGDAAAALALVARLASQGADLRRFVADGLAHFRGIFLAQYASNIDEVVDASTETIAEWKQQATVLSSVEVLRTIDELSTALLQLRDGREERLVVEISLIRLTRPETVESVDGLHARIGRMERELTAFSSQLTASESENQQPVPPSGGTDPTESDQGGVRAREPRPEQISEATTQQPVPPPGGTDPTESDQGGVRAREPRPERKSEVRSQKSEVGQPDITLDSFLTAWPAIMAEIRETVGPRRQALLREASPRDLQGSTVVFEVASHMHFHLEQLKADSGIADAIADATDQRLGSRLSVSFRSADAPAPEPDPELDLVPDKDDLLDADDDEAVDPVAVVANIFDGQIIE